MMHSTRRRRRSVENTSAPVALLGAWYRVRAVAPNPRSPRCNIVVVVVVVVIVAFRAGPRTVCGRV